MNSNGAPVVLRTLPPQSSFALRERWKNELLDALKELLTLRSLAGLFDIYSLNGEFVYHNMNFVALDGFVTNIAPNDSRNLPAWVVNIIDCLISLVQMPANSDGARLSLIQSQLKCDSLYAGFELDLFQTTKDYLTCRYGGFDSQPIIPCEYYDMITRSFDLVSNGVPKHLRSFSSLNVQPKVHCSLLSMPLSSTISSSTLMEPAISCKAPSPHSKMAQLIRQSQCQSAMDSYSDTRFMLGPAERHPAAVNDRFYTKASVTPFHHNGRPLSTVVQSRAVSAHSSSPSPSLSAVRNSYYRPATTQSSQPRFTNGVGSATPTAQPADHWPTGGGLGYRHFSLSDLSDAGRFLNVGLAHVKDQTGVDQASTMEQIPETPYPNNTVYNGSGSVALTTIRDDDDSAISVDLNASLSSQSNGTSTGARAVARNLFKSADEAKPTMGFSTMNNWNPSPGVSLRPVPSPVPSEMSAAANVDDRLVKMLQLCMLALAPASRRVLHKTLLLLHTLSKSETIRLCKPTVRTQPSPMGLNRNRLSLVETSTVAQDLSNLSVLVNIFATCILRAGSSFSDEPSSEKEHCVKIVRFMIVHTPEIFTIPVELKYKAQQLSVSHGSVPTLPTSPPCVPLIPAVDDEQSASPKSDSSETSAEPKRKKPLVNFKGLFRRKRVVHMGPKNITF